MLNALFILTNLFKPHVSLEGGGFEGFSFPYAAFDDGDTLKSVSNFSVENIHRDSIYVRVTGEIVSAGRGAGERVVFQYNPERTIDEVTSGDDLNFDDEMSFETPEPAIASLYRAFEMGDFF